MASTAVPSWMPPSTKSFVFAVICAASVNARLNRAFTEAAQIAANTNDFVEGGIHEGTAVEAMTGQRSFRFTLRAVIRAVSIRMGDLFTVTLDGAGKWM